MEVTLRNRLSHAWNVFLNKDPTYNKDDGPGSSRNPIIQRLRMGNERSIIASIYNRIAIDVAANTIQHVRVDDDDRLMGIIPSSLNEALTLSANIDQTGRGLIKDAVMSMFDEGCIAIVPVETSCDPKISDSFEIQSLRVAEILEWFPSMVRVRIYNEKTGYKQDITLPKSDVVIIENPLYVVMNEPNSIAKRLIDALNTLDAIGQQAGSGKLDLIIQLPYVIKTEARREQAEKRRKDVENQLAGSKYGIAYTDGTEKVTQLNRPAENNLMATIEYLTSMLFSQLGLTASIFDGTADEKTMLNYYNRTIDPILSAITEEMKRKFLTKTARTQKQSIKSIRNPFKLVPVAQLADIADKFTRNEVLTSNEVRDVVGYKPSSDPNADLLKNKNIRPVTDQINKPEPIITKTEGDNNNA